MQLCSKCKTESTVYEICLSCRGLAVHSGRKKPSVKAISTVLIIPLGLYFGYGFITKDAKVADKILNEYASTTTGVEGLDSASNTSETNSNTLIESPVETSTVIPDTTEESVENNGTAASSSSNGTLNRLLPKVPEMYSGAFKFTLPDPVKGFVHWDACRALEYVVNTENAPAGALDVLSNAMGRVSEASGLKFSYLGTTNEKLGGTRSMYQPSKYRTSTGWAPILVVFQNDAEFNASVTKNGYHSGDGKGVNDVKGFATPLPAENSITGNKGQSGRTYVSGVISIRSSFAEGGIKSKNTETLLGIYIHELAHLLGLAHVDDPNEIMYYMADNSQYGPGDLQGLSLLGGQDCLDKATYPVPYNLIAEFNK